MSLRVALCASALFVVGGAALLSGCADQGMANMVPFDPTMMNGGGKLTWYKDVLPIARERCQTCHVEDGIAPFSMMKWEDVAPHTDKIGENVASRIMPPWMPDPNCADFKDSRRLSETEMATFAQWIADGAEGGDPADAPAGGNATAQHLASVDATLMADTVYTPNGDPTNPDKLDDYHCFILDPALTQDQDLIGYEVIPGVTREVHHVLLYPASPSDAAAADAAEPGPGWTCFGGPGTGGASALGGWAPGMPPVQFPANTGLHMKKGDLIVMQVHYNLLNGPPLPDRTTIKLDYSDGPVAIPAQFYPAINAGFNIPPHADHYSSTSSASSPLSFKLWGVLPHMHTLGNEISVKTATRCLVDIPKWDFHWQQLYFYQTPIEIQQGENVSLDCTWSNPRDSNVTWGEGTTDEMCVTFAYITF
jgi:hypothetical protein